jgi:hypothetical protein
MDFVAAQRSKQGGVTGIEEFLSLVFLSFFLVSYFLVFVFLSFRFGV